MRPELSQSSQSRGGFSRIIGCTTALAVLLQLVLIQPAAADRKQAVRYRPPSSALHRPGGFFDFFGSRRDIGDHFSEVIHLDDQKDEKKKGQKGEQNLEQKKKKAEEPPEPANSESHPKLRFVSQNPEDDPIRGPDYVPDVRLNPDAPSPIKGAVREMRAGNYDKAARYADSFVKMQKQFLFEVRDLSRLLIEALVRQNVIDEDDLTGVNTMIAREMALSRQEMGEMLKADHDTAMERVAPDPGQKAEVLYFFTMSCSWCRYMASDIERLWRILRPDSRVKFTALTIGPASQDWVNEYKRYHGMTMPVLDGEEIARQLKIGFVPAVVVLSPGNGRAYVKTGQQTFERMYDFVRTVQGLPAEPTAEFKRLAATPIGEVERKQAGVRRVAGARGQAKREKPELGRF